MRIVRKKVKAEALPDGELRCDCGNLIARFVEGQLEIKCRRCKRTLLLDIGGAQSLAPTEDRS